MLDAKLDKTGSPLADLYELFDYLYIIRRRLRLFHSAQIGHSANRTCLIRDKKWRGLGRGILFVPIGFVALRKEDAFFFFKFVAAQHLFALEAPVTL